MSKVGYIRIKEDKAGAKVKSNDLGLRRFVMEDTKQI